MIVQVDVMQTAAVHALFQTDKWDAWHKDVSVYCQQHKQQLRVFGQMYSLSCRKYDMVTAFFQMYNLSCRKYFVVNVTTIRERALPQGPMLDSCRRRMPVLWTS